MMTMISSEKKFDCLKTSNWYKSLANYTFPTSFVKLSDNEKELLVNGIHEGEQITEAIHRLRGAMKVFFGNKFVFVDCAAPTDTERFRLKGGAVYSAESAWKYLALSEKVRKSIANGDSDHICVRPFRRMGKPKEFRLFIKDKKLLGMSQLWLIRHFKRLEGIKEKLWEMANTFFSEVSWLLPAVSCTMDIYFTASGRILIVDFNPWGEPVSPLLFRSWDNDWENNGKIKIIPPPIKIKGDVKISF
ncbi:MAG TPA: hypothetical protein P5270_02550 [Victivallales bacterium]|nr:hypothetical protein [Victivallales bacterium]HPO89769.1 hypothetical protein [Victivallales bacterium]HRR28218.1 hypothetical protein [Victivallales bacterium]